jgi:hypothetical protein
MTEILTNWKEVTAEQKCERRRQARVNLRYPIEVSGFNLHGRYFTERTFTVDVSDGGCKFPLAIEVEKESVVAIRVITRRHGQETDTRPVLFHVNWVQAEPNAWTLGVSKLQAGAAWCSSIPPDEKLPETVA